MVDTCKGIANVHVYVRGSGIVRVVGAGEWWGLKLWQSGIMEVLTLRQEK